MVQLSVDPNPNLPVPVAHADEDFIVLAKPAGLVTQPGVGHTRDTVLNAAFALHGPRLQNLGKARDFGLLHRLDRPTSGLVVVALTPEAYDNLRAQFAERRVEKTYLALVHGAPKPPSGIERTPLREARVRGRKRAVLGEGRGAQPAVTRFHTLVSARGVALLVCEPQTGRLHQIRAHLAHRGHPVIGDHEYGPPHPLDRALGRDRLWLHAAGLRFAHPRTGRRIEVIAPIPAELKEFLVQMGIAPPRAWR
ncbi:MAG: RluA family pseudouridine synthase [Myxococcales bacterium]|nr:RluA family pseudouridine synthase [Myxococcales bacterium]